jgi:hypothetical protein
MTKNFTIAPAETRILAALSGLMSGGGASIKCLSPIACNSLPGQAPQATEGMSFFRTGKVMMPWGLIPTCSNASFSSLPARIRLSTAMEAFNLRVSL